MRISFALFLLVLPFCYVSAATLSAPDNSFILLDIDEPAAPATYYGVLDQFPHTYQFNLEATTTFSAIVSGLPQENEKITHIEETATTAAQVLREPYVEETPDLSLILVKTKRRGVSEIGRVQSGDVQWEAADTAGLGVSLLTSGEVSYELVPGVYKLEVSSPENESPYRLQLNGGESVSYGELFMVRSTFDKGWFSLLFTWRIGVPLVVLFGFVYWHRRKRGNNVADA